MHYGFPVWIVLTHFLNILFLTLLARSGIEILSAFPKLYLSDHCPPGREFIRFTKRTFSADSAKLWSSLDEEESWSPAIALPGRKNLGLARHWHFMTIQFWILTGLAYVILLFVDAQWRRLVPTHWSIVPDAFRNIATYLSGGLAAPQLGLPYDAAQQLAYFAVVFVLAPLQVLTGAAMSPSVIGRFPWYPRLFGGKQVARSIHFLNLCALVAFVLVHTVMVVIHGIPRESAAIVLTSYHASHTWAVVIAAAGILFVIGLNALATVFSLRRPRRAQRLLGQLVDPLERLLSRSFSSHQRYSASDISPYHRVNGYPPPGESYHELARGDFADYRLDVGGLVEQPLLLTLDELRALGWTTQITKHNCIQGWSNVAEWGGVPLAAILERCKPLPEARYLVFHGLDDKTITENEGRYGYFYGTIPLYLALKPQSILALEMNGRPLPVEHGAPARVRIETQLGFKMVKWVRSIELVRNYADIGQGQGGWREDQQYYANAAGI
jgi:DMSO/TMAO reductase YedYZ molybdopterin-dependent catalytic subunit/thiosulfate reductase cytochrome b subunit